jgi:hypothetical protein
MYTDGAGWIEGVFMKSRVLTAALAATLFASGISAAYAQIEEVVVTAERRDEGAPHIFLVKRADHLITKVRVTCDTRELSQRKEELRSTLRNMIKSAAQSQTISLGLGDQILGDLTEANFDDIIVPDTRPDTSQAYVVIKTGVSKTDTFNSATARVKEFVDKTTKVGRTEILLESRWDLTLIGPEQYRDNLVTQIVADAKHNAELFGPGYGITIEGLERPVSWYQKGPLDLALFIPYTLHIAPLGSH